VRENKKIKKKDTKILHVKKGEFGRVWKRFRAVGSQGVQSGVWQ
jgi:hypothetical protein